MQETSPEFETAVANHRTWVPPRLRTAWDGVGYSGDGTVDDLTAQMGESWEVDHTFDDGYPDSVTFVSGTSVPELSAELVGRSDSSPVPVSTTSTWSGSTANTAVTANTATLTVPGATLVIDDWLFFAISNTAPSEAVTTNRDDIPALAGPTIDGATFQTTVYGCRVTRAMSEDGLTFTASWATATRYTLVGASVGARDPIGRACPLALVEASQTNETGSAVTNHTTPTVVSTAVYNVVTTLWCRAVTDVATWTPAGTDVEAVEAVGSSGSANNMNSAIDYGATIEAAGSLSRTATTTAASFATMAIVVLSAVQRGPMTAAAYWSPLRTDSPVHGYDRDVPPVTLDVGLVTEAGVERVRVFTGQMVNTPVRGGRAELQTISATRLKLMKLVQPPAFTDVYAKGAYATWPVSYALAACGVYAGPQIRPDTAWYAPMHGSAWPMIPSTNRVYTATELLTGPSFPYWIAYEHTPADVSPVLIDQVDWIAGPYVSAPDLELTASMRRALYHEDLSLEATAADAFSQAGNKARLEMWVRGDATDVNNAPGGSASVSRLCSLWGEADHAGSPYFRMGITPTRKVEVSVYDGTNTRTLTSTGSLATDGAWYFVGAGYDLTADTLWVNLGGTVETSTTTMLQAGLPAADVWASGYPIFLSVLPVAEVTLTTGAEASVTDYPLWRSDASFAPTAVLYPSTIQLKAIAEPEPREAWQIIAEYARAELASVRLTELDAFEYLPIGWWVQDAQQVVQDHFSTALNAAAFDIDLDPTKIRNAVKVSYTKTDPQVYSVDNPTLQEIYAYDNGPPIPLPPGVTVLRFNYGGTGILPRQVFEYGDGITPPEATSSWVTLCDVADGIGNYATSSQVSITYDAWTANSATLRFVNVTPYTWYIVNDMDIAALRITGVPIDEASTYVTDYDATSIAARGERSIDVSAPALQTEVDARRLARNLKMALRYAVPTIGADQQGVEVTGNPARQPGDLATFEDSVTGVTGGLWRLRGVHHRGDGAKYTQAVVARQTLPIMIIGEGLVGHSLIGPHQD